MKNTLRSLLYLCSFFILTPTFGQGWQFVSGSECPGSDLEEGPVSADTFGNVFAAPWLLQSVSHPAIPLLAIFGTDTLEDLSGIGRKSILVCTDSLGNYKWELPLFDGRNFVYDVEADNRGNVYLIGNCSDPSFSFGGGYYSGTSSNFEFCAKVSSTGSVLWVNILPLGIHLRSIKISTGGSVYLSGSYSFSITFGTTTLPSPTLTDLFVAKYDADLSPIWAKGFGGDNYDEAIDLALTEDSLIYVIGSYQSSNISFGATTLVNTSTPLQKFPFVAKLDDTGGAIWANRIVADTFMNNLVSCSADGAGNVYIGGSYLTDMNIGTIALPTTSGHGRMFAAKYDADGNTRWATSIEDNALHSACQLVVDECDNVWVCGQGGHTTISPADPMYIARFDTAGNLLDTTTLLSGGDDASYLTVDKKGNLFVAADVVYNSFLLGWDSVIVKPGTDEAFFMARYRYNLPGCIPDTNPPINHHAGITNAPDKLCVITIFPNPSDKLINIKSSEPIGNVKIFNLVGQLIFSKTYKTSSATVSLIHLPSGTYLLRTESGKVYRVVKE